MNDTQNSNVPEYATEWVRMMARQFERTEQASFDQQQAFQDKAIMELASHSLASVPAYKDRLSCLVKRDGSLDLSRWQDVPLLERKEAVTLGADLFSNQVPQMHLPITTKHTSGSTGIPLEFKKTQFSSLMSSAITLRYHRWHKFDYSLNLCSIRPRKNDEWLWPKGEMQVGWEPYSSNSMDAGMYFTLNINTPVEQQVEWLRRKKPKYLHSFATNLRALAMFFEEHGGEQLKLSGILSYGEMLPDDTREIVTRVFGCNLVDCYSSRECGYMALQSPETNNYLVQSEVNLVEVLNDHGQACQPGEMGKVVVTSFHEFSQPLIRYVIGDYAEVGSNDQSGLPFPVLSKINGRFRNMFRLADGGLIQPDFTIEVIREHLRPKQWQVAQTEISKIEVRIVPGVDPAEMNTKAMTNYIRQLLGKDMVIEYKIAHNLQNSITGKHEDYVCELA